MSAEGIQQQAWPDLDVSYFRWEPPVFAGAPVSAAEEQRKGGKGGRVESAFANSSYPTNFAGWDRVRAATEAEQKAAEALAGRQSLQQHLPDQRAARQQSTREQQHAEFALPSSAPAPESFPGLEGPLLYELPAAAAFQAQHHRPGIGQQGASSAFTSLRSPGSRSTTAAPVRRDARNFSWPSEREQEQHQQQHQNHQQQPGELQLHRFQHHHRHHPQQHPNQQRDQHAYGASFEGVFAPQQPASLRVGMSESRAEKARAASGCAAVDQRASPILMVQCGHFRAPVQREPAQRQTQFSGWTQQPQAPNEGLPGAKEPRKAPPNLQRAPSGTDPLALQEYYTAQSDLLEDLMKDRGGHDPHLLAGTFQGGLSGDMGADADFLDVLGPLHLGRATSAMEVPMVHAVSSAHEMEPYMPQWQSESVPAELPNHVVNRLMMRANNNGRQRHNRGNSLSGSKRDWTGLPSMPSIPDDKELPSLDLKNGRSFQPGGQVEDTDRAASQDVNDLEELVRTADVEVAHRAFLVPPHKKRGKGGRQPAADPRLDPNIDSRRAKRILANRLSAARSKMKQKNQMDSISGMVAELEDHKQLLRRDAAELMEICEKTEFENRRLRRQATVLAEYGRRQTLYNARLVRQRSRLTADVSSHQPSLQQSPQEEVLMPEGHACAQRPSSPSSTPEAARYKSGEALASKPSDDSLLRGLNTDGMSPGDALLDFAQDS